MKLLTIFAIILFSINLYAQDINEQEIISDVEKVTVFFESAQITRHKKVNVKSGKTILKFVDLSPFIDAKSLQAKVYGEVTVLSVNHQQNFMAELDKSQELKDLENEKKVIEDKISIENTYLSVISDEISFLQSNKVLGGKEKEVSLLTLKETAEYYGSRLTELRLKDIERRKTISQLNQDYQKIVSQINSISTKKDFASGEILITIDSKSAKEIEVDMSYLVSNAGWFPSYDVRAKSVDDPLEIVYKANVHQDTKVEWNNVKLTFSSSNPSVTSVAPKLLPYLISYNSMPPVYGSRINMVSGRVLDSNGQVLPGAAVHLVGSTISTVADGSGFYSLAVPVNSGTLKYSYMGYSSQQMPINSESMIVYLQEDQMAVNEVMVSGYDFEPEYEDVVDMAVNSIPLSASYSLCSPSYSWADAGSYSVLGASPVYDVAVIQSTPVPFVQKANQTTVEFEIDMPYSIKTDSKNYVIEMTKYNLPAYYQYYCIPKVDEDAFLIANVTGWEKYNLLDGEANLFFEGTFVGKSLLDLRFVSDTLSISLGRDKQVIVDRTKVKDFTDRQFIGSKKEETRGWEISVKNNKPQKINMVIIDQIPVPALEEIELTVHDVAGADFNKETGEVKWTFSLNSNDHKALNLKYAFKYPKTRNLIID